MPNSTTTTKAVIAHPVREGPIWARRRVTARTGSASSSLPNKVSTAGPTGRIESGDGAGALRTASPD